MHTSQKSEEKIDFAADFASRQKLLFDHLSSAEILHKDKIKSTRAAPEIPISQNDKTKKYKKQTQAFRGQESIFKRPNLPIPRSRRIPDHKKHPSKWTRYSLADVSKEEMSNNTNSLTAFTFLKELKKRNLQNSRTKPAICESTSDESPRITELDESEGMDVDEEDKTVVFRKPAKKEVTKGLDREKDNKSVFRNSKVLMPEYIVGSPRTTKEKKTIKVIDKTDCKKELILDHLQMNDEQDEA